MKATGMEAWGFASLEASTPPFFIPAGIDVEFGGGNGNRVEGDRTLALRSKGMIYKNLTICANTLMIPSFSYVFSWFCRKSRISS